MAAIPVPVAHLRHSRVIHRIVQVSSAYFSELNISPIIIYDEEF